MVSELAVTSWRWAIRTSYVLWCVHFSFTCTIIISHPSILQTIQWHTHTRVEKYRPRTLDDVVGNEDTTVRLRAIAEDGNMPNLILCGPPGTGKVRSCDYRPRWFCHALWKRRVVWGDCFPSHGKDLACCYQARIHFHYMRSSQHVSCHCFFVS